MNKRQIVIGTYNHLPEGLDAGRFETIYQTCYRPFLSTLNRFPEICVSLHYSGSLLARLETRHQEFLMLLEKMVSRKQVELEGGGFHAPVFPLIPAQDRLGQVEQLTTFIRKHFGKRPRGAWLSNYAWEPSIAAALRTSGMDYTFLLDRHFKEAGLAEDDLFAPVLTEDQGKTIAVFPVFDCEHSFDTRVGIADALERVGDGPTGGREGDRGCSVVMLPGEAARALWERSGCETPDLYFETEFNKLRKAALQFETVGASKALRARKRFSRAYFPCCAVSRIVDPDGNPANGARWTGSVRSSVLRCQQSLDLYSKMHYVHLLVGQLRGDKARKASAQECLWAAQTGDAYWRSGSPGIEDLGVRLAAYRSLIDAELTTRVKGAHKPSILRADLDFDGEHETVFQGHEYNAFIRAQGAVLFEFDAFKPRRNYTASMTGAGRLAACFADTLAILREDGGLAAEARLSRAPFAVREGKRPNAEAVFAKELALTVDGKRLSIVVEKTYTFRKNALVLAYAVSNRSETPLDFALRSSSALTPSSDRAGLRASLSFQDRSIDVDPGEPSRTDGVSGVRFAAADGEGDVSLSFDKPVELAVEPVESDVTPRHADEAPAATVSLYQGVGVDAVWRFSVKPERSWTARITLEFGES